MSWRLAGLLLAVLTVVGLPYVVTLANSRDAEQAVAAVVHTSAVKALTYRIAYVVRDSEVANYRLLAGDDNTLLHQRAASAVTDMPGLLRELRDMTRGDTTQQLLVGALENKVSGRLVLVAEATERLQKGDLQGAKRALHDSVALFGMSEQVVAVAERENQLLAEHQATATQQASNARTVLTVTALAQLLLLTIVAVISEGQIGRRRVAETREGRAVSRSQQILQAVREPIALFDENMQSLLVNTAFSEMYGLGPRRAQPLAQMGEGAWSDSVLLQRLNDVLLRDRELWDYEVIQRTADGVDRHVVINARRLQKKDSDAPALLVSVSDFTARALAEQQVNKLNRQLEGKVTQISDVNRELEAFSYSVSHDLRAPLRHIAGFARKLEQHLGERIDDKASHYIDVVATSAQRMAMLIDDLLVFSRLGRGALRLQAVDMQSLVEEAQALVTTDAPERRIIWTVAPLPMAIGDENMLRTVWQNLLGNAVKYTGHCAVARIDVSVQQNRDGDYVFTVADNGVGFDMQYADKLFGVFQRLHRTSEFPGSGIGLANVQRIITRHGGRIWAEAEPGNGARFHFSLPATDLAGAHH